ncbi:MAG TPA: hypothetical protein VGP61_06680 [Gemmatimonadales bacterium]|jgi:histidine ammonia-lyase|nr:hypothetical protein [Gemmatimonadales bacterium]
MANAQRVVAAELLAAAQGLEFLRPLRPGRGVELLFRKMREPPGGVRHEDRPPGPDLERLAELVATGELDPGG